MANARVAIFSLITLGNQVIHTFQTFDSYIQSADRSGVTPLDVEDCGKELRRLTEEVGNMDGLTERHLRLSAAKLLLCTLAGVLNRPGNVWDNFQGTRPEYSVPDRLRNSYLFLNLIGDLPSAVEGTREHAHLVLDDQDGEQVPFMLNDLEKVLGDMDYDEDDDLSQMVERIVQRFETLRASTPGLREGTIKEVVVRKIDEYIERLEMIGN